MRLGLPNKKNTQKNHKLFFQIIRTSRAEIKKKQSRKGLKK